uniref:Uncharacterized protein n=1 Tax=Amphimedon queenslandica TaxID=400682 RepID=A0A1X7SHR5_AMPQE
MLSLALEPEVAAIAAQHQSEVSGTPPERYMVVDIGGGTVDITVHDKSTGRISVLLPPMGNTWGGTTINEALSMLLEEAVDDGGFQSFIESDPIRAIATLNKLFFEEFEERKKRFGNEIEGYNLLEEKIFKSTVDKIIECVRAAFDELTDHIDTVYLVGGFGGC